MSKKPQSLSLADKQLIIKMAEDEEKVGAKANLTKLGQKFNVHRTTIGKILKSREDFKDRISQHCECLDDFKDIFSTLVFLEFIIEVSKENNCPNFRQLQCSS